MVIVFSLMAFVTGTFIRNSYIAFLIVFSLNVLIFGLQGLFSDFGFWMGYFILGLSPISTWNYLNFWFTEGGISTIIPLQELISTLFNLGIFLTLFEVSKRCYFRKDL